MKIKKCHTIFESVQRQVIIMELYNSEVMEATVKKCWVSISFAFCGFEFFCECRVQHYN